MIYVTGATGFVGGRIVEALRSRGFSVRCLVRESRDATGLEELGCEIAIGDVTDPASVEGSMEGCDVVVHLVAIIVGRPEDFHQIMEQGTRHVVAVARSHGIRRFILMSALGTSEARKDLVPYFHAKWDMERTVVDSGLEYVIFRPSLIFGPGGGAITDFARLVRYLPITPIVGSGTQRIQPIDIADVAAFVAGAIDLPEAANRTFDLGGPEILTWNEFWPRLQKAMGKQRRMLHVPTSLLRPQAALFERLPKPLVTRDQLTMLEAGDNVCDPAPAAHAFGIELTTLDEQLRRSV